MTDYILPNYSDINRTFFDVAADIDKAHRSSASGFWKGSPSGLIHQGEAYMNGSRTLIEKCGPLMNPVEKKNAHTAYNQARHAKEQLDSSGVSGLKKFRRARKFKSLSKDGYEKVKGASNRAVNDSLIGPMDRTDSDLPGAGAPVPPDELESDGTDPPAGAPSASIPEECKIPPPHDHFTDSPAVATSNIGEGMQDTKITTLSTGAAGEPTDEVPDTYSFIYDPSLASSVASIVSYKTDKTVNSRKSRYNARPRRRYSDSGHLRVPQGIVPSDVHGGSVTETDSGDEYFEASSGPLHARPNFPEPELVPESRPGPSPETQPLDGLREALPATEHVQPLRAPNPLPNAIPPSRTFPDQLMTGGAQEVETATIIFELTESDRFGTESEAGVND